MLDVAAQACHDAAYAFRSLVLEVVVLLDMPLQLRLSADGAGRACTHDPVSLARSAQCNRVVLQGSTGPCQFCHRVQLPTRA